MADYDYEMFPDSEDGDFYPDFYPDNDALHDPEGDFAWEDRSTLPPMSPYQLILTCIRPTLNDGLKHILKALMWCVIFRFTTQTVPIPSWLKHLVSCTCGSMLIYNFFGISIVYLFAQGIVAYLSLIYSYNILHKYSGWICMSACIIFILICEFFIVEAIQWHVIRAAQMLVAMRAISIGFQLDGKHLTTLPQPLPYFGYIYNPGTAIFGPWISFNDYLNVDKNKHSIFKWICNIVISVITSLCFLSISACWSLWLIPPGSFKWFLAFRDALSFRCSHYFVSYLSEATALASGVDLSGKNEWTVTVTRPWNIEFPRSLVEVVVHWNVPMHTWLKSYVFQVAKPYGTFIAIFGTYGISALLHGLNFQLAAVLLSLGLYTYTEHVTRYKLASIFNCCIQSRKCKSNCGHRFKDDVWQVKLTNLLLSLLAVFHLAYLGLMFDSSKLQEEGYSYLHVLNKWRLLGFTSHWICLATLIFYWLI